MEHWRTVAWRVLIFDKLALKLRLVSAPSVFAFAKNVSADKLAADWVHPQSG